MFCYKCGKEIADGSLFCDKCGAKQSDGVNKEQTSSEQQVPPTQQQTPTTQQQVPPAQQQVPPTQQQVPPTQQQVPPMSQQTPPYDRPPKNSNTIIGIIIAVVLVVVLAGVGFAGYKILSRDNSDKETTVEKNTTTKAEEDTTEEDTTEEDSTEEETTDEESTEMTTMLEETTANTTESTTEAVVNPTELTYATFTNEANGGKYEMKFGCKGDVIVTIDQTYTLPTADPQGTLDSLKSTIDSTKVKIAEYSSFATYSCEPGDGCIVEKFSFKGLDSPINVSALMNSGLFSAGSNPSATQLSISITRTSLTENGWTEVK